MTIVYGIKNCDQVKKALHFLDAQNINYQFHDFKTQGISAALINTWLASISIEQLINKRSTTWKQLSDIERDASKTDVVTLCMQYPTLIKRPVLQYQNQYYIGFDHALYQQLFLSGAQ